MAENDAQPEVASNESSTGAVVSGTVVGHSQAQRLHPKVAAHVFNRPLMAHPSTVNAVMSAGINMPQMNMPRPQANGYESEVIGELEPEAIGPHIVRIPISGVLVQYGSSWEYACMSVTGYDDIRCAIEEARANGAVGAVLDVGSGGGEVAGCFDLVDYIYSMREEFPIYGIANDWAYSAAYAILSACKKVFMTRTAGVGSIGVIAKWQSQSVLDADVGQVREITSRRLKNSLSPHNPDLTPEGMATLQAMVNESDKVFVETVARNRGIPVEAVGAFEAGEFFGQAAISVRLVDQIMNYEAVCELLVNDIKATQQATAGEPTVPMEQGMKISRTKIPSASADTTSVQAATPVKVAAEDEAVPAPLPPSNDPKPMFGDGAKIMVNAAYSSQHGQKGTVVGEPTMTYVYSVRCEGSDVAGCYAENELGQPGNEENTDMSAQNAKALLDAEATAKREAERAKAAEEKAARLEAQLMDQELVMQGADPKRLSAYRMLVNAERGDLEVKDAVAKHKAANPDWYAYAKETPVQTEATKPEVVTQAEQPKTPVVAAVQQPMRMGKPETTPLGGVSNGARTYGPQRR